MQKVYPFMRDPRYVEIVKDFAGAYKNAINQKKSQVIDSKIKEDATAARRMISDKLNKFYHVKKNEIEAEKSRIKQSYKSSRKEYSNPEEETLRRQDFEMEVMSGSDSQLTGILNDSDRTFTKYEINRLQVEFRKRDMDEATKVQGIKESLGYGKEYEKDANYQALEGEDGYMLLIRNQAARTQIFVPSESGHNKMLILKELEDVATRPYQEHSETPNILENGYRALASNVQSNNQWLSQFNKQLKKDAEEYVDYKEAKGDPVKVNEYQDNDIRAVRGSGTHDVIVEYNYLKERYHEFDNPLYTHTNPNFSVETHINYLRGKHEQNLKSNPDLAAAIQTALSDESEQIAE